MSKRWTLLLLMVAALAVGCGGGAMGAMTASDVPGPQMGGPGRLDEVAAMEPAPAPEPTDADATTDAEEEGGAAVDFMSGAPSGTLLAARAPAGKAAKPLKPPAQPTGGQPTPPPPGPKVVGSHRGASGTPGPKVASPLLIYTATFRLAVFEVDKTVAAVDTLARELGGYLVRRDRTSITVRVPAGRYQGALQAIGKLGDVLDRQEEVEDVTDKFYDLKTRLANARAIRDRLQKLLEQAKDVKEALAVERELGRVTGDIERMAGRLKRLKELIAFSTITVVLQPRSTEAVRSNFRLPFQWLHQLGLPNLLNL